MVSSACWKSASSRANPRCRRRTGTSPSVTPACANSSSVKPEWVVVLGWQTSVSTPPSETALRAICRLRRKFERSGFAARDLHGKHGARKVALRFLNPRLIRIVEQGGIDHARHVAMIGERFSDASRRSCWRGSCAGLRWKVDRRASSIRRAGGCCRTGCVCCASAAADSGSAVSATPPIMSLSPDRYLVAE